MARLKQRTCPFCRKKLGCPCETLNTSCVYYPKDGIVPKRDKQFSENDKT